MGPRGRSSRRWGQSDRMPQYGLAPVASICQPCCRGLRDAWLPVCIDSGVRRDSRVATVSDGLAGGRCLNHRRRRFSAFRRQGVDDTTDCQTLRECNLRVSTRLCRLLGRASCGDGIGCRRDGCLHAARFARPCHGGVRCSVKEMTSWSSQVDR